MQALAPFPVRRMSTNAAERDRQCIYHSFRTYCFVVLFQISEIRHRLYTIACSMFRSNCWFYDYRIGSYRCSDVSRLSYRKGGNIFEELPVIKGKRYITVHIATGYMPDVSGFETRWEKGIFSSQSPTKSALEPIRAPVQWARRLILEVKRSVRAVDHLPLSEAKVQIGQTYIHFYSPSVLSWHLNKDNFTLSPAKIWLTWYGKGSVVWSGSMDVDKERRTNSANF